MVILRTRHDTAFFHAGLVWVPFSEEENEAREVPIEPVKDKVRILTNS